MGSRSLDGKYTGAGAHYGIKTVCRQERACSRAVRDVLKKLASKLAPTEFQAPWPASGLSRRRARYRAPFSLIQGNQICIIRGRIIRSPAERIARTALNACFLAFNCLAGPALTNLPQAVNNPMDVVRQQITKIRIIKESFV